jgi:predicted transglutaminase-like cysteine proteinase
MEENMELRKLLWLNHGHSQLYGDDGEMQCHECGLDFKRDPVARIAEVFEKEKWETIKKLADEHWKEVQRLEEQVKTLMNQSEKYVITGKVTYPNDIGQHPADCQCTACWKRRAYL